METLILESDSLTILKLKDLLVVVPNIRGAWPVPLGTSALGVGLNTSSGTSTTRTSTNRISLAGISKVDRRMGTTAKELLLSREQVFFIIFDSFHQPNLIIDGVSVVLHR
jgi:hypothetical protein